MKYVAVPLGALDALTRFVPGVAVKRPGFLRGSSYAVFFIIVFVVFLALRFPSSAIVELAGKYVEGAGLRLTAVSARLSLPLGVRMSGVTLSQPSPGKNVEIISAENVEAGVPVLTELTLRRGVYARAKTLGGAIGFNLAQRLFNRGTTDVGANMEGVNPGLLPALAESGLGRFNGALDGDGSFSFEGGDPLKGAGSFKAHMPRPGSITLSKTMGGDIGDVAVDVADVEISFKSGALNFDRVVLKGPQISISVTGDAIVNANPQFTRLNMKTQIHLYGKLAERLGPLLSFFPKGPEGATVIKISGTVGAPVFR
jgi:type II secretion system protein N